MLDLALQSDGSQELRRIVWTVIAALGPETIFTMVGLSLRVSTRAITTVIGGIFLSTPA